MFPLDIEDINLLFAVIAIILLVSLEMMSAQYGNVNMPIDKRKLKNATVFVVVAFLITLAMRMVSMLTPP
jgi:hypothetical protein